MKVLITGACGFVGSYLAHFLRDSDDSTAIVGIDSLAREGSERNRPVLKRLGVQLIHGDVRLRSDIEALPPVDWVVDAAAQPSVLAGRDGRTSSRQLVEHNLAGTINLLEYCRVVGAGFLILSTSRVYSIDALRRLPLNIERDAFAMDSARESPQSISAAGVAESFTTEAPISLYGATKLASERLALEYAAAFGVPLWINRCGVLAGGGQFGTAEQGIFSYWVHAHATRRPLRYLGFGGRGFQVRDALHPRDLARLIAIQLRSAGTGQLLNVSGGVANSMSLAQLTAWCNERFGRHEPAADGGERPYDVPWLVLDSAKASAMTGWAPRVGLQQILDEIAEHAVANPDWLTSCGA